MTVDTVFANIQEAEKVFRSLIISTYYKKEGGEITWSEYSPGIFKNIYAKEYETIIRNRQYSFLLKEGKGCIQFYYSFDGSNLQKMKLCYYPYPVELRETSEDIENHLADSNDPIIEEYYYDMFNIYTHRFELSLPDEKLRELVMEARSLGNFENEESIIMATFEDKYKLTNSSHLRIDYDPDVTSHHKCEIQVGAVNNIRMPVNKIIMPFTFCDFIFKNIFPADYTTIAGKSTYGATFTNSKNRSVAVTPFRETNIFNSHL